MTYRTLLPFATRSLGNSYTLNRDLDRLFKACGTCQAGFAPRVDVLESAGGFAIMAELPGLDAADINIDVEDNVVTLSGARQAAAIADGVKQHLTERRHGAFRRSFALPVEIDADKVAANFKNGLLEITLPRVAVEQPKAKKVTVQTA